MTPAPALLQGLEIDALTELVNIGVSRAAASLREMVHREVLLSVPSLEVTSRAAAASLMGQREDGPLVTVRQEFSGAFNGHALLIFPEASSRILVQAVAGDAMSAEELTGIEEEALTETGNVVLSNCLATIANMLQRPLNMSLPGLMRGREGGLFGSDAGLETDGIVLFFYIDFSVSSRNIRGYIAVVLDLPALETLKVLINDFIARVAGPGAAART